MLGLALRRILFSALTLLMLSAVIFGVTELLPGDAASAVLGREATEAQVERLREELGLNRPAPVRYAEWLGDAVQGDLGVSVRSEEPVSALVAERARNTLLLAGATALIALPLALLLGVIAGLMRDRAPDVVVSGLALVGLSLPEFVVGALLIWAFALRWPLLPAITTVGPDAPLGQLLPSLVLPVATLTVVTTAYVLRMARTGLIDVLESDYVRTATLKGLPRSRVILRHALPNALLPTINAAALTLASLVVGGVVVVEAVFNYPGLGALTVAAVQDRDLPLVQGLVLLGALAYVAITLAADLLMLALDPRLRTLRG